VLSVRQRHQDKAAARAEPRYESTFSPNAGVVLRVRELSPDPHLPVRVPRAHLALDPWAKLFNCTDIATVFLDTHLRIRRFTAATVQLLDLIATDVGRPLLDITNSAMTSFPLMQNRFRIIPRRKAKRSVQSTGAGGFGASRPIACSTVGSKASS